jgi:hypothetical protein
MRISDFARLLCEDVPIEVEVAVGRWGKAGS